MSNKLVKLTTVACMRSPLLPRLPLAHAIKAQTLCKNKLPLKANIEGYSTPAVSDVGGASVRIKFDNKNNNLDSFISGGYLLGIRNNKNLNSQDFLPAIAGIPWEKGLDRDGKSRIGLGELMVLARPLNGKKDVTFLPKKVLQELYPTHSTVDIVLLKHCTDFFLGLNAGRWLMLRMSELCEKSSKFLINEEKTNIDTNINEEVKFQTLLNNSGISWDPTENPEDPEPDQAYLFHHYNLSGNGGISGQKIIVHHDDDL